jgi:hypothetical protein
MYPKEGFETSNIGHPWLFSVGIAALTRDSLPGLTVADA